MHCGVKKGGFPLNSGPALPLPAARGRCGPVGAELQRHAAAAAVRSEAAECRGTPAAPLRIFPLTLRFRNSFISVGAAARVCPDRICPRRPSICPSGVWEGQTHRSLISGPDNFSSFLFLCPLPDFLFIFQFFSNFFFFCWRSITGRVIPALSRRW